MAIKLAFVGFGGVGQGLLQILLDKEQALQEQEGMAVEIVAVSDVMKGSVYDPHGLDAAQLLSLAKERKPLEEYRGGTSTVKGLDSIATIRDTNADVIVEVTFTDVKTGQPAIDHCEAAFSLGKSVITTNKGPIAIAYKELSELAEKNNAFFGFEGTVMSGTPALRLAQETLCGNEIKEITGILNGTTNYMLTKMEEGLSYDEALKQAQAQGFAEADPTSDVEGYDARYKAVILSNVIMNTPLTAADVSCTGITEVTQEMLADAIEENKRIRLVAKITKTEAGVTASVAPEKLDASNPLANVPGATNAILYDCDLAGPIFLTGAGAGLKETGFSLLIDLIHYVRKKTGVKQ